LNWETEIAGSGNVRERQMRKITKKNKMRVVGREGVDRIFGCNEIYHGFITFKTIPNKTLRVCAGKNA